LRVATLQRFDGERSFQPITRSPAYNAAGENNLPESTEAVHCRVVDSAYPLRPAHAVLGQQVFGAAVPATPVRLDGSFSADLMVEHKMNILQAKHNVEPAACQENRTGTTNG
jgi:hypothetical protein